MLQLIAELAYSEYYFDEEYKILKTKWKAETKNMVNDDQYKDVIIFWLGLARELKPDFVLINSLDLNYPVSPDLQDWVNREVFKMGHEANQYSKKVALILPTDFIAMLSTQQLTADTETTAKKEGHQTVFNFFDNEEEALDWIKIKE
jgi:hypothetical protein